MSKFEKFSDADLRDELKAIDERDDIELDGWEGRFLQSVVFGTFATKKLTEAQREAAAKICGKYEK